jgi:hypothetical protein
LSAPGAPCNARTTDDTRDALGRHQLCPGRDEARLQAGKPLPRREKTARRGRPRSSTRWKSEPVGASRAGPAQPVPGNQVGKEPTGLGGSWSAPLTQVRPGQDSDKLPAGPGQAPQGSGRTQPEPLHSDRPHGERGAIPLWAGAPCRTGGGGLSCSDPAGWRDLGEGATGGQARTGTGSDRSRVAGAERVEREEVRWTRPNRTRVL